MSVFFFYNNVLGFYSHLEKTLKAIQMQQRKENEKKIMEKCTKIFSDIFLDKIVYRAFLWRFYLNMLFMIVFISKMRDIDAYMTMIF